MSDRRQQPLGRAGASSLEFALMFALFFIVMIGISDLAWWMIVTQSVTMLLNETGRACLIDSAACGSPDTRASQISAVAPWLDASQVTVTPTHISTDPNGWPTALRAVQVSVSYPYRATLPWLAGLDGVVSETSTYVY